MTSNDELELGGSLLHTHSSGLGTAPIQLLSPVGNALALSFEMTRVGGWGGRRNIITNLNTTLVQSEPHLNPGALQGRRAPSASTQPRRARQGRARPQLLLRSSEILQDSSGPPNPVCLQLPKRLSDCVYSEINNFEQVITGAA